MAARHRAHGTRAGGRGCGRAQCKAVAGPAAQAVRAGLVAMATHRCRRRPGANWLCPPPPPYPLPPQFVLREEASGQRSLGGIDWVFNAWGGGEGGMYATWERDQAVAATVLQVRWVLGSGLGDGRRQSSVEARRCSAAGASDACMCTSSRRCTCPSHICLLPAPCSSLTLPAGGERAPLCLPYSYGGGQPTRGRRGHAADHR